MISIRELADNNTTISSTRWAFATIILFDIVVIALSLLVFVVSHFIGKPIDLAFFDKEVILLGVLTAMVATTKGLMGFEPHNYTKSNDTKEDKQIEQRKTEDA